MLNPLVVAACEKVILDEVGNATLIMLLNEIHVALPADGTVLPPAALSPKEWAVFAMWTVEQEDFGHDFVQHMHISFEDGTVFTDKTIPFHIKPNVRIATNRANIIGFPVGKEGKLTVTVWLEGNTQKYAYPVFIVHDRPQPSSIGTALLEGIRR
jgi:hypothetical protein